MPDISYVNLPDGVTYNIADLNALHHITVPDYDSTQIYSGGDYATYNGDIYMCNYNMSSPEPWVSYHWHIVDTDDSYLHSLDPKGAGPLSINRKDNTTVGYCSATVGLSNEASGSCSFSEGSYNTSSGSSAHSEGSSTRASGNYSHSEGHGTISSGSYAHAEGYSTTANHRSQHVFGEFNIEDPSSASSNSRGNYIEIVGNGDKATQSNARTLDWSGNEVLAGDLTINGSTSVTASLNNKADKVALPPDYDPTSTYAVGDFCTYNGDAYVCVTTISTPEVWDSSHWILDSQQDYLHSINPSGIGSFSLNRRNGTTVGILSFTAGRNGTASGNYSHAEGDGANATGMSSHAEGISSTASREGAHAEGVSTTSSGISTHAEGRYTTAYGNWSHAEGDHTTSIGEGSHAEGYYTETTHRSQHVFGEYNILDSSPTYNYQRGQYAEIVGNGTADDARSNARTLDWSGNEVLAGGLKINNTQDVATQVSLTQAEYDALVSAGTVDLVNTIYFITDANAVAGSAAEITYSNTTSGLSANTVQSAIDEVVGKVVKFNDITISSTTADSGIPPFSYLGTGTITDASINNILGCSVYDTQYNNPAICAFYSQSGSTYTFIVYSGRSGSVKIRVLYN